MNNRDQNHELVHSLFKLQKKHGKLVRSTVYDAPEDPEMKIRSWKMSEHHYYKVPSPFPTLARGLFTTWVPNGKNKEEGEGTGSYRIVARGYDKFFNIGEVPWTTWDAISKHTRQPYTLTVKSNGCIIFIAALTPEKLLVTSKHSIGPIQGQEQSHSQAGDSWLDKHLASVGRKRSELASVLWENGWTAVAELCDDSFEEHVLAYAPESTGLHLHGINRSIAAFETLPSSSNSDAIVSVESFAKEWGFIPTRSFDLFSVKEVKEFTDSCSITGSWRGEPLEGFVIRTQIRSDPQIEGTVDPDIQHSSQRPGFMKTNAPPYPLGSSFFFKVKFDEPYMMYRDWREITKTYLSAFAKDGAVALRASKASNQRLKRPETRLYDYWVRKAIREDPELFSEYQHNRGIVRTRQFFLDWMVSPEGREHLAKEKGRKSGSPSRVCTAANGSQGKAVIAPIAVPGCGKTSVAVALTNILGFSHTQSDDVVPKGRGTKTAPIFEASVLRLLQTKDVNVVIADKNNHLKQHRSALRHILPNADPPVRLIALHWPISETTKTELHRICAKRIAQRGEDHQTLRVSEDSSNVHEEILWKFINSSEELGEDEVDDIIEMDIHDDTEASVRRAVSGLCKLLRLEAPSEESIHEGLRVSSEYSVPSERRRTIAGTSTKASVKKKTKGIPRYFGIVPSSAEKGWNLSAIVDSTLSILESDVAHDKLRGLWKTMTSEKRVTEHPHVTLVHQSSLQSGSEVDAKRLWDACISSEEETKLQFCLSHLVYNNRIMAFALEPTSLLDAEEAKRSKLLETIPPETLRRLHITIGTAGPHVKPVEAGELVLQWRNKELKLEEGGAVILKNSKLHLLGRVEGLWS